MRTYTKLLNFSNFEDRFNYLATSSTVGVRTFGSERYLNQHFYSSHQWRTVRNHVIVRDNYCDLGIPDRPLPHRIYIHHMNPITRDDIIQGNPDLLDPEFLISVSFETHNAIHYGDLSTLSPPWVERTPGDTQEW